MANSNFTLRWGACAHPLSQQPAPPFRLHCRDLEASKAHIGDEAWVTTSSAYKLLQQQYADATDKAQSVLRQLADAQNAKSDYLRAMEKQTQQAEVRCCVAV